ncbi:MAG: DUF421 domain-containing protein [Oscillospiraceae bacterium]|nr:DUF421 domain-containing protein [Oscillospiraceae bacterium]
MISVILRTTIMYLIAMFALRMMGKKNLGEFQPSDFVSTMLISNLTSIVIEAPELPLLHSVIPILMIMCYEIFMSVLVRNNTKIAKLSQGTPKILIINGTIQQSVMDDLRLTVNDILKAMRSKDIFYLEEVNLAVVETTGTINIYPDPEAKTNIKKAVIPPFDIIIDGKTRYENLEYIKKDSNAVEKILEKEKKNISDVMLLLMDGNGQYNITVKEKI